MQFNKIVNSLLVSIIILVLINKVLSEDVH